MRTFLWLLLVAFFIECLTAMILARFVMLSLENQQRAAPGFTGLFFGSPAAWLLVPAPWLIAAVLLSRRLSPSPMSGFLFSGTLIVAAALVLFITAVSCILPSIVLR